MVTFAGRAILPNTPPSLAAISNQTVNAGQTLSITNGATDSDVPLQTLAFSLLAAPTNATIDPASGVFTWRPLVAQADTTNLITVQVVDSGTPSLSATNRYQITVRPLIAPVCLGSFARLRYSLGSSS